MQPMKVDGCENICHDRLYQDETGVGLDLLPHMFCIKAELARGIYKIFLQYLQRNHARPLFCMLQYQCKRTILLCRIRKVIAIEKDIRVQKRARSSWSGFVSYYRPS